MADFTALKEAIQDAIKQNGQKEITGEVLQTILLSMVSTLGDDAINTLSAALTAAITSLTNDIGDEATARASAVATLNQNLNSEAQTRAYQDGLLSNDIQAEAGARQSQDAAITHDLNVEAQTRAFQVLNEASIRQTEDNRLELLINNLSIDFDDLLEDVRNMIRNYNPIVINGDVTNAPDENDLTTTSDNLLKFKDNVYNPIIFSGMGKKFLRKNLRPLSTSYDFDGFVDDVTTQEELSDYPERVFWDRINEHFVGLKNGVYYLAWTNDDAYVPVSTENIYMYDGNPYKWNGTDFYVDDEELPNVRNVLTQDMINEANTIYVIRYDYTLAEDVTIPSNCVLQFEGGSLNGEHTITGNNTGIEAGLVKIFNTDVILAGTWNVVEAYPEWFGAKGDGVTNDSDAIAACCLIPDVLVVFQDKVYIVEIKAGISPGSTDPSGRRIATCKCGGLIGINNATIRLSDNDNANKTINKGFSGLFHFDGNKSKILIEGLTFDFNYEHNIPVHAVSNTEEGGYQNIQCTAIHAYSIHSLSCKNCNFVDFAGTNVIATWVSDSMFKNSEDEHTIEVSGCNFIGVGKPSIYNGEVAVHDHSTLSVHLVENRENQQLKQRLRVLIRDNQFIGAGGSAYNTAELCGDDIFYENNYIYGYEIGMMPLASTGEGYCYIKNNVFDKVSRVVAVWDNYMNTVKEVDNDGFNLLEISSNKCVTDYLYSYETPNFQTINYPHSDIIAGKTLYYNSEKNFYIKGSGSIPERGAGIIKFENNMISCINYEDIPYSIISQVSAVIACNFIFTTAPQYATIKELTIEENNIKYCSPLIRNVGYREIGVLNINNNIVKVGLNINPAFYNEGIIFGAIKTYTNYDKGFSNVCIKDNVIRGNYPNYAITSLTGKGQSDDSIFVINNIADCNRIIINPVSDTFAKGIIDYFVEKSAAFNVIESLDTHFVRDGEIYLDTTHKKFVVWNGTAWVDNKGYKPIRVNGVSSPVVGSGNYGLTFYNTAIYATQVWNGERWITTPNGRGTSTGRFSMNDKLTSYDAGYVFYDINLNTICIWNGGGWQSVDGSYMGSALTAIKGTSTTRTGMQLTSDYAGTKYYDTDLKKYVYWDGTAWVDATGATL